MQTTRYFEQQVLRKRPYLQREWCEQALHQPERMEIEGDSRIYYWISIPALPKPLRVVTLGDGKTVHNAYPDSTVIESS
jgi:hypothetical protein